MNGGKTALPMQCKQCGYTWVGIYLPLPIEDAVRVLQSLCCPMCASRSDRITMLLGAVKTLNTE